MTHTCCLLVATLLTAQLPEPSLTPTVGQRGSVPLIVTEPHSTLPSWRDTEWNAGQGGPSTSGGLFPRLRQRWSSLFGSSQASNGPTNGQVVESPSDLPQSGPRIGAQPGGGFPGQVSAVQTHTTYKGPPISFQEPPIFPAPGIPAPGTSAANSALQRTIFAPNTPLDLPLNPLFQSRVSHTADYSSVTGQLYFLPDNSGTWVIRFASVQGTDSHGGHFILTVAGDMSQFHPGDLVILHGSILNDREAVQSLGAPLYRATQIQLVERGAL